VCPLCPGTSDVHLFGYGKGIINLDAEIAHGLSILVCPSSSWTARKLPVRRYIRVGFVRRSE